jgi:AcrR family transcriptional regulator
VNDFSELETRLRNVPSQQRSRVRLRRVLDAADEVLAQEGPAAFTTTRIAQAAGVPVGSVYRYFPDKQAIVEALALSYWSDFEDLIAGVAETDERDPLADPCAAVIDALAAAFRASPGFLALWYGGLLTEQVRSATRPTRTAVARSVARFLGVRWPSAPPEQLANVARMIVLAGDGLMREAFRVDPHGDQELLDETKLMLDAYVSARLGPPS